MQTRGRRGGERIEKRFHRGGNASALPDDEEIPFGGSIEKGARDDRGRGLIGGELGQEGDRVFADSEGEHLRNAFGVLHEAWTETGAAAHLDDPFVVARGFDFVLADESLASEICEAERGAVGEGMIVGQSRHDIHAADLARVKFFREQTTFMTDEGDVDLAPTERLHLPAGAKIDELYAGFRARYSQGGESGIEEGACERLQIADAQFGALAAGVATAAEDGAFDVGQRSHEGVGEGLAGGGRGDATRCTFEKLRADLVLE